MDLPESSTIPGDGLLVPAGCFKLWLGTHDLPQYIIYIKYSLHSFFFLSLKLGTLVGFLIYHGFLEKHGSTLHECAGI